MGGFANLQQVLAGSGFKLSTSDADSESDSSNESGMDTTEDGAKAKIVSALGSRYLTRSRPAQRLAVRLTTSTRSLTTTPSAVRSNSWCIQRGFR